ncbi:MAG TPA: DNA translocase FtsK 4TM domain-containing protein [Thermodesulfovibrionales bacterium]|nr:DNA translocase FtsK 4TM domain-containing protein [Thermodesulfovibrionales bacterium]
MDERLKRIRQEVAGVVALLCSVYILLSLVTYSKWDPSSFVFSTLPAKNYGGVVGSYISDLLISAMGLVAFAIPAVLAVYGMKRLLGREGHWIYVFGTFLFLLSSSLFSALVAFTFGFASPNDAGGVVGQMLSDLLKGLLSLPGAYIFSLALWLSSLIILSPVSLVSVIMNMKRPGIPEDAGTSAKAEELVIVSSESETVSDEPIIHGEPLAFEEVELSRPPQEKPSKEAPSLPDSGTRALKEGEYALPPLELLKAADSISSRPSKEDMLSSSSLLERKLKDFDVEGKVTQVHPGPVVTMYEFEPAPGVKINRIVSLSDDLALSLKAQSVRVSTIPGKAAIGIEVPNRNRETVSIREIISSENYKKSHTKLTLALGKDIFGNPIVADLSKMPHLLVAGATGSGKSVSINSMVVSILYKATPREVKMLMIDPKLLELSYYENIPHLISPVITGAKEAAEALRKMVFEMERRYRLLAEKGVRNIEGFNRVVPDGEQLPYIVIFIDELADLMFASGNEVEDAIARLAQMARASGIHLILATQRPSVDVITGVIKANFPARIAFQVTSRIDSRTIIDCQGAEQLLGKGDMLLMLPGLRIIRVHGALVTEEEIKGITDFITPQGIPDYSIFESIRIEEAGQENDGAEKDDMYDKVLEFAESVGEVSISSIQRRFKIGYNRAARIMELMEDDGLVGPPRGAGKPRDYLGRKR